MWLHKYADAVISCKLKQNANEGCNSCASLARLVLCFIACFILLVIAPLFLTTSPQVLKYVSVNYRLILLGLLLLPPPLLLCRFDDGP